MLKFLQALTVRFRSLADQLLFALTLLSLKLTLIRCQMAAGGWVMQRLLIACIIIFIMAFLALLMFMQLLQVQMRS